jgi:hypothetical protein
LIRLCATSPDHAGPSLPSPLLIRAGADAQVLQRIGYIEAEIESSVRRDSVRRDLKAIV